jgi:hypothetical protein
MCKGCCNKDWDLGSLRVCTDFKPYDEILLTGGEPLLVPKLVIDTVYKIRVANPSAKIYMYTARTIYLTRIIEMLNILDGITITLHEQSDVELFYDITLVTLGRKESLRVNIFKGIEIKIPAYSNWKVKKDIEWIKDCPLPENEVFMKLKEDVT